MQRKKLIIRKKVSRADKERILHIITMTLMMMTEEKGIDVDEAGRLVGNDLPRV